MTEPSNQSGLPEPTETPAQYPVAPAPQPYSYGAQFGIGQPTPVDNNIGWAIGALMACVPFGIPALIKALEVNSLWQQGQIEAAQRSADAAKKWGKIGVYVGIGYLALVALLVIAYFVFIFVMLDNLLPEP